MYKGLVANYEEKTVTEIGGFIRKVVRMNFDNKAYTIDETIEKFERNWNFMRTTIYSGKFPYNMANNKD